MLSHVLSNIHTISLCVYALVSKIYSSERSRPIARTKQKNDLYFHESYFKLIRKNGFRHITESPEERECKRKNCPQANFAEPRMWLLVHRPKVSKFRKILLKIKFRKDDEEDAEKEINNAVDEELEDDEDDDESEEEEEPAPQPVTELVAVKKYR